MFSFFRLSSPTLHEYLAVPIENLSLLAFDIFSLAFFKDCYNAEVETTMPCKFEVLLPTKDVLLKFGKRTSQENTNTLYS